MSPNGAVSAIAVEDIVKRYGDFEAVSHVTFDVKDGEIFGLLGPNGAGKSTLIRMMTTLIPVTSGRAIVAGHDVMKEPDAVRQTIAIDIKQSDVGQVNDGVGGKAAVGRFQA